MKSIQVLRNAVSSVFCTFPMRGGGWFYQVFSPSLKYVFWQCADYGQLATHIPYIVNIDPFDDSFSYSLGLAPLGHAGFGFRFSSSLIVVS